MSNTSGLSVRQFERHGLDFQAELIISDEHSMQVAFSPHANAVSFRAIRGKGVDLSVGGAGLECKNYVPRLCTGTLRVFDSASAGLGSDDSLIHAVIFEHPVRVRRVQMLSSLPTYGIGLAFIDSEPGVEAQVDALTARLASQQKSHVPGGQQRA